MYEITFEDLLGNAFIATDINYNRFIPYYKLDNYAKCLVEYFTNKGIPCKVVWNRDRKDWILYYYSSFFQEITVNGIKGVLLKDNVSEDILRENFSSYLSVEMLVAFRDENCIKIFKRP